MPWPMTPSLVFPHQSPPPNLACHCRLPPSSSATVGVRPRHTSAHPPSYLNMLIVALCWRRSSVAKPCCRHHHLSSTSAANSHLQPSSSPSPVVSHRDMYHTNVLMYRTMVLLARPTKVRRLTCDRVKIHRFTIWSGRFAGSPSHPLGKNQIRKDIAR